MTERFSQLSLNESYVMVAAIDFGTTYSGYAFSFKSDKNKILMNKNWGENIGFQSYKTPTCLLLNSRMEFDSFGYDAENKYSSADDDDQFHLFRHFKMMLHSSTGGKLTRGATVASVEGKNTSAITVFAKSIEYLKNHMVDAIKKQTDGSIQTSMIRWVITVPAIWTEEAKQFMREAAHQAGLIGSKDSRQLVIALEPESASVFCRSLQLNQFHDQSGAGTGEQRLSFKAGTKYLVIDAGGGTVDLTAHEVLPSGKVKEIHTANGGAWGGTQVDAQFIKLLEEIFGASFIQLFKKECSQPWLYFMVSFEKVKRTAKPDGMCKMSLQLPYDMGSKCSEKLGKPLDKVIKDCGKNGVSFSNGMLVLKHNVVVSLFQATIDNIVRHIHTLMKVPEMRNCTYFLIVGGFGESAMLQEAIMKGFKSKVKVMIPDEAQMSVIKGAVLFGHAPEDISERKARKTYGTGFTAVFDESIHDENRAVYIDGTKRCSGVFSVYVKRGESVKVGEPITQSFVPLQSDQTAMDFRLFQTDDTSPMYVDEFGCKQLGNVHLEMPDTKMGKNRSAEMSMTFGGTEIQVLAKDDHTGRTAKTTIDFLSE